MKLFAPRNRTFNHTRPQLAAIATIAATGLTLSACGGEQPTPGEHGDGGNVVASEDKKDKGEDKPERVAEETAGATPRLVATYDGGILTLDADTLEVIDDTKLDGFNRLNQAGDGRTVLVSTKDGFQVFDAGVWTQPHGDHTHSYQMSPELTDTTYEAKKPGHVVAHDGRTLLFGDGDGSIQELTNRSMNQAYQRDKIAKATNITSVTPHHGVAVALPDGGMAHTEGTEDERHSVVAVDANGKETARTDDCPGVHGEAAAKGGVLAFGCEDGVVIFKNGTFEKVEAPDSYGRIGNQTGSEKSEVILGDYKVKKDPEVREQPTRISLTNTATGDLKLVELGASYSFRSLGRGPAGEALVLGDDGNLRKIDPSTGEIVGTYPVVEKWVEPEEWQDARPTLFVQGDKAYVTEPAAKKIHVVDIASGDVVKTADTPEALNELTGVKG